MIDIGPPEIRRLPNGTIDTAFYVLRAQRARSCAAAAFFRRLGLAMRRRVRGGDPAAPARPSDPSCLGTKDAAV